MTDLHIPSQKIRYILNVKPTSVHFPNRGAFLNVGHSLKEDEFS